MKTALAAALLLAAAVVPAAAASPASPTMTPGMWSIATTIDAMDMPGGMGGVGAFMRGRTITLQQCVTPEQAARGPAESANARKNCTFAKQQAAYGRVSVEATCQRGRTTEQVTEEGDYSPTAFHLKAHAVATGSMSMTSDFHVVGTRTGDCK